MSAQPVDVLAARAAEILAESHSNRENLAIRIARLEQRDAAVDELIEADKEYDDALRQLHLADQRTVHDRFEAAKARRAAALARVQGGRS